MAQVQCERFDPDAGALLGYHDLERQLQAVDQQIHELVNDNFADGRLLAYGHTIARVSRDGRDLSCMQLKGGFATYRRDWDDDFEIARTCAR